MNRFGRFSDVRRAALSSSAARVVVLAMLMSVAAGGVAHAAPICLVDPEYVVFDSGNQMTSLTTTIRVTNGGDGILSGSLSAVLDPSSAAAGSYSFSPATYELGAAQFVDVTVTYHTSGRRPSGEALNDEIRFGPGQAAIFSYVVDDWFFEISAEQDTIHFYSDTIGVSDTQALYYWNQAGGEFDFRLLPQPSTAPWFSSNGHVTVHGDNTLQVTYLPMAPGDVIWRMEPNDVMMTSGGNFRNQWPVFYGHGPLPTEPECSMPDTTLVIIVNEVGGWATKPVTITNSGGGTLAGNVTWSGAVTEVTPTTYSLGAGESQEFIVRGTALDCTNLGAVDFDLPCGTLDVSVVSYDGGLGINPQTVVVTSLGVGTPGEATFELFNFGCRDTNHVTIGAIDPALGFTVAPTELLVPRGETRNVTVTYSPSGTAPVEVDLPIEWDMGSTFATLVGEVVPPPCEITPSELAVSISEFGSFAEVTFTLVNNSANMIDGTVTHGPGFFTIDPPSYSVDSGQQQTFNVMIFSDVCYRESWLDFGTECGIVPLYITNHELLPLSTEPAHGESLILEAPALGEPVTEYVTFTNYSCVTHTVTVSLDDPDAGFSLGSASFDVASAATEQLAVTYVPTSPATTTAVLHVQTQYDFADITLVGQVRPTRVFVSTTGSDTNPGTFEAPWATIQHAIDNAATGDTINLMAGRFAGDGNRDLDFLGKGLVVRSWTGDPASVLIDCEGTAEAPHFGFRLASDEPDGAAISGVTIHHAFGPPGARGAFNIGIQSNINYPAVHVRIADCVVDSSYSGIQEYAMGSSIVVIERCEIRNSSSTGIYLYDPHSCEIRNSTIESNADGIFSPWPEGLESIQGCTIRNNHGAGIAAAIDLSFPVVDCLIEGNVSGIVANPWLQNSIVRWNSGVGVRGIGDPDGRVRIVDSEIYGNGGNGIEIPGWIPSQQAKSKAADKSGLLASNSRIFDNGGSGIWGRGAYISVDHLTITGNGSYGITLQDELWDDDFHPAITNCTIAGNGAGIGIYLYNGCELRNTIIADNIGAGLDAAPPFVSPSTMTWTIENCDIVGNGGGNSIVPDVAVPGPGIMSRPPLFCDPDAGDYSLAANSPCAPTAVYDLIGALEVGCEGFPAPVMMDVGDIPDDQGGQVRLLWYRSGYDAAGSDYPVLGYDVYRRTDPAAAAARSGDKLLGWDYLVSVPARGDQGYQVVVPTLWDSTVDEDRPTAFMVSAVTADPLTYFDSTVELGASIDNLAPSAPDSVFVAYGAEGNDVSWAAPEDPDVAHYDVWRIVGIPALEDLGDPHASVTETHWLDTTFAGSAWEQTYVIAAVDHAGNRGPVTDWGGAGYSATPDEALPRVLALQANVPNPFNPSTRIIFDLPRAAAVDLSIYDVAGRRVCRLAAGDVYPAGQHEIRWAGRDDAGRAVAAGVYVTRLKVGDEVRTNRMTLVK